MFKELIISILIVVLIVVLDFVTQNYTKEAVNLTSTMLNNLKYEIKTNEQNMIDYNMEKIFKSWEQKRKNMAYFIEHDELEKVETNLTNIKSYIAEDEFEMAITSIDEAKYILSHIEDKNSFNLENIF
jgi:uncharacterized membrane protein YgaE (UPF0421/DUF939 family)